MAIAAASSLRLRVAVVAMANIVSNRSQIFSCGLLNKIHDEEYCFVNNQCIGDC